MITAIPLTIIPLIIYNIIAFAFPGTTWTGEIFGLTMVSGARWALTLGDLMIMLGITCLFLEILKSGQTGIGDDHQPHPVDDRPHHLRDRVHPGRHRRHVAVLHPDAHRALRRDRRLHASPSGRRRATSPTTPGYEPPHHALTGPSLGAHPPFIRDGGRWPRRRRPSRSSPRSARWSTTGRSPTTRSPGERT